MINLAAPAVRIVRPSSLKGAVPAGWSGAVEAPPPVAPGTKLIHFVRHAQGFHNVDPMVMKAPAGIDAQLTDEGRRQCSLLANAVHELRPEIIVTSPLTRTGACSPFDHFLTHWLSPTPAVHIRSANRAPVLYHRSRGWHTACSIGGCA